MGGRVYIEQAVLDDSDSTLIFSGRIVSGEVEPGMELHIGLNSSLSMSAVIDRVERTDGQGVRLLVQCEDAGYLLMLDGLGVHDEEVEVRSVRWDGAEPAAVDRRRV